MTRVYMRVAIIGIILGLLIIPTAMTQSELNTDKSLSFRVAAELYRENAEVRVEPGGYIQAWATVEGSGVQMGETSLDFSGPEWGDLRWLRANARQSRDPNDENAWVDIDFETEDLGYAEDVGHVIMEQINSRLLQDWFEFRGSNRWKDERDPNTPSDDMEMVSVHFGAHIDFPWFIDELDMSLPREMGGIAANIDVTGANEAWFQIYREHNGGLFDNTMFIEQLGVQFNRFTPILEGGHELVMEELLHLAAIERSPAAEGSWYGFNLPGDVENLSSHPSIGDYEGYSVYAPEPWYEGWQNIWRRGIDLDIHDPTVSLDSFRIYFDYKFRPRAHQTNEDAHMYVDPYGGLDTWMGIEDPSATLANIDYESELYEPVSNIRLGVENHLTEETSESPSPPAAKMLAMQVDRSDPNIHLDIEFYTQNPMYADLANEIAAEHAADLGIDVFQMNYEDQVDGRYQVGYYGWVDWNLITERAENPVLNEKSALYNAIDFTGVSHIENYIWYSAGELHLPVKSLGVRWWMDHYFEGAGEHFISTQFEMGYVPIHMLPAVDRCLINIEVPGRVIEVIPPKDSWGNGFDVRHNMWDDEGFPRHSYELDIFSSNIEFAEFGVVFDFEFFEEGTDILPPDIHFRYPYQGEHVSDVVQIEVDIWDDMSGVDPESVVLEVSPYPLLNEWTELEIWQEDEGFWKAEWDTTTHGDGTYRLLIRAADWEGHNTEAEISVEVDNYEGAEPPEVKIVSPRHGDTVSGDVTVIAEVYSAAGLERVGITIDGMGFIMEQISETEWSYTFDSTKRADGGHEIVVIAYARDGSEGKADIMIFTDNDVTENASPDEWEEEAAFFIPGFAMIEVLLALGSFGLLLATRKRR